MNTRTNHLRVIVVGGGIGGLCLAQGLTRDGIDVAVYERDRTPQSRLQGYRVSINGRGTRALHACLPASNYDAFLAGCGESFSTFTILSQRAEVLFAIDFPARGGPTSLDAEKNVSRISLRRVLLDGLLDRVHFDKRFTHYERRHDGRVVAHFDDGSSDVGDVLVGADGGSSRVRRQRLPWLADRVDPGVRAIAGKLPLTVENRALLPRRLAHGPAMVIASRACSLFVTVQQYDHARDPASSATIARPAADPHLDDTRDYIMWGFGTAAANLPPEDVLRAASCNTLHGLVREHTAAWHPDLRALIERTEIATTSHLTVRTSRPTGTWPTENVTLLGDAIHSMTPYRGIGANTALRDAHVLCQRLTETHRNGRPLLESIRAYEAEMRGYAFRAVRASMRSLRQAHQPDELNLMWTHAKLRAMDRVPLLKRLAVRV